ncbi:MAG TPA: hypothetical protein VF225_10810 [Gaiellaceae bacterium]
MSTYDESLLAARFAALAPEPLIGDWDDVLDRARTARNGRGLLGRLRPSAFRGRRRRLVLMLAAAALVVVVATASALAVRAFILDRGFIGLPPQGATPSAPESGELVVLWLGRSATNGALVRSWVYADGRIIWSRSGSIPEGANELTSGYLEQRLTPEGVELLRSAVAGLFDGSRTLLETVPAPYPGVGLVGSSPLLVPPGPADWGLVEVPRGDRLVRLAWLPAGSGEQTATPEQLSALRRVDALLTDPASVLPPSAWAIREVKAYVPSHYAVCIETSPPKAASQLLSLLPARAADVLRANSVTRLDWGVAATTYCSKLATEKAREVAEALSGLDQDPRWQRHTLAYRVAEGAHNWEATAIWFEPYFPHGQFTYSASG